MGILKNNSGMTLAETIVSVVIISVISILMLSTIAATMNIITHSADTEENISSAFSAVEDGEYETEGDVGFEIRGSSYSVQGIYFKSLNTSNPLFVSFDADE